MTLFFAVSYILAHSSFLKTAVKCIKQRSCTSRFLKNKSVSYVLADLRFLVITLFRAVSYVLVDPRFLMITMFRAVSHVLARSV